MTMQPKLKKFSELKTYSSAAEYRAELDKRRPYALAVSAAFLSGNIDATAAAQKAFREAFPED
jgi:hypothetical protein